jgi:hypothetical protein
MNRCRIAGGVAEPHVVRLGHGAADLVLEDLPDVELLEPEAGHGDSFRIGMVNDGMAAYYQGKPHEETASASEHADLA